MRRPLLTPILLLTATALAGCWRPTVQLPPGRPSVAVPLERAGDALLVRVRINDRDAGRFLVDTGAEGNLIDREVAAELGLPWVWRLNAAGVGGRGPMPVRSVRSMQLGEVTVESHILGEIDFAPISDALGVPTSGVIGDATFSRTPVTVDYRAATLTFHDPSRFRPPPGVEEHAMRVADGQPYVAGVVNGRYMGWFLLDTGYTGAVELTPAFTRRHPELLPGEDARIHTVVGVAGRVRRLTGRIESFTLMGHHLGPVEAEFLVPGETQRSTAGEIGVVPAGILRNFRLTFDFAGKRLWAEWVGPETVAEVVARGVDLNEPDARGWTLLHEAARKGDAARAANLVAAGADPDARTPEGNTALLLAASRGHAGVVVELIARGADVNLANSDGATPLLAAARRGEDAVVASLLGAGAAVEVRESQGRTPVMTAAFMGHLGVVRRLLAAGADLDAADDDGVTPLMAAAYNGHTDVVRFLLEAGARLSARHQEGVTALFLAAQNGHAETALVLLAAGADPDAPHVDGTTPLMVAAEGGHGEVVDALLAAGADAEARDSSGRTAADHARRAGHGDLARRLRRRPAA